MWAAVIGAIATVWVGFITVREKPADIHVISARVLDVPDSLPDFKDETFNLAAIDFLIENRGDQSGIVTSVDFEVLDVLYLVIWNPVMSHLESSQTYQLLIDPLKRPPYRVSVPTSQAVESNKPDRFTINVSLQPFPSLENVFHLRSRLKFSNNAESAPQDFVLVIPDLSEYRDQSYFLDDFYPKRDRVLAEVAEDARRYPNAKHLPGYPFLASVEVAAEVDTFNRAALRKAAAFDGIRNNRAHALISTALKDPPPDPRK